jgi:hypothetical protein
MEDFGYKKDKQDKQSGNFNKQIFLILATILSISLFIYITITAYHFFYQDDENVELIKATHLPIRVGIEDENNKNNENIQIDRTIYEDIFGNKKEAVKIDNSKVSNTPESSLPPKKEIADKNFMIDKNRPVLIIGTPENTNIVNQNNENKIIDNKKLSTENPTPIASYNNFDPLENSNSLTQKNSSLDNNNDNIASNSTNSKLPKNIERKKIVRVQIAAMSSREIAEDQWKKLLRINPDLFVNLRSIIQKVDLGKRGIFYRLQIGDFFNQIEAESFCQKYISQTQKTRADCIVVE